MNNGMRLLPWTNPDGKPCYLSSDNDGKSRLAALADHVEAEQLACAESLLAHARRMLADPAVPHREFRFVAARLAEALTDTLRIAHRAVDR